MPYPIDKADHDRDRKKDALGGQVMSPDAVECIRDAARDMTKEHLVDVVKRLAMSHERLRMELDGAIIAAAPDMYRLIRKCYKVLHMGVWEVYETDQEVCEKINDVMRNHFGDAWRPKSDEVV